MSFLAAGFLAAGFLAGALRLVGAAVLLVAMGARLLLDTQKLAVPALLQPVPGIRGGFDDPAEDVAVARRVVAGPLARGHGHHLTTEVPVVNREARISARPRRLQLRVRINVKTIP